MNKWLFFGLLFVVINTCNGGKNLSQLGEKQMANLIFDEQFEGFNGTGNESLTPLANRGWNTGTSPSNPFYFEQDSDLGKVVTYIKWTNGRTGMPDNASNDGTIYKGIPISAMNDGVTIHFTTKFHNFIYNGSGGGCHGNVYLNPRGSEGNAPGEITIDPFRQGNGAVTVPDNSLGDIDRTWTIMNNGTNYSYRSLLMQNMTFSFLEDDIWYDVIVYIRTNNGSATGQRWALWSKEHGAPFSDYHKHMDYTDQFQNVASTNPIVMMAGYFHNNYNQNEVRMYTGNVTVWEGNAMEDGTIGDSNSTTPTPPPVITPPDPGTPTDPLTVTDFSTVTTDTTATLTWVTNRPANAVVDYGDTDTRGTIIRDNAFVTDHTVLIEGLQPETTYFFRFSSKDEAGETLFDSVNKVFTTAASGTVKPPVEPTPPDTYSVVLDVAPVDGTIAVFRGDKWVAVDLDAEIANVLQKKIKITIG